MAHDYVCFLGVCVFLCDLGFVWDLLLTFSETENFLLSTIDKGKS